MEQTIIIETNRYSMTKTGGTRQWFLCGSERQVSRLCEALEKFVEREYPDYSEYEDQSYKWSVLPGREVYESARKCEDALCELEYEGYMPLTNTYSNIDHLSEALMRDDLPWAVAREFFFEVRDFSSFARV